MEGATYEFRYHDKLRTVRIEKVGPFYIVAENISIDGGVPDKQYSTYRFDKMEEVRRV